MKYFVSATLKSEVVWQIELLIESFKLLGIEDKLVVFLSSYPDPNFKTPFLKNISSFKNVYITPNYGKFKSFESLNDIKNILLALDKNVIDDEFIYLPSDCVIYKEPESIKDIGTCRFHTDLLFSPENINSKVDLFDNFEINPESIESNTWPYASKILHFKGFHVSFFEEWLSNTEKYVFNQYLNQTAPYEKTNQVVINLLLRKYLGKYFPVQLSNSASSLQDHEIGNFVCYESGFHPIFNKNMFAYNSIALANPFEVLAANKPTIAFAYVSGLAERYLKSNN